VRKTTSEGFGRDGPVQTVEGMGLRGSREPRFGATYLQFACKMDKYDISSVRGKEV
jgi:hypothetical protein